jgi:predicted CopG family antitoxin
MTSKTISVTEEVYELLSRLKLPHESLGDVIKRLCEEKTANSLIKWISEKPLWSDMSEEEYEQTKRNINDVRKKLHAQEVNLD